MINNSIINELTDVFLTKIYEYNKPIELSLNLDAIKLALRYAIKYHANQTRHSGEPYYYHPIEVALIAAKICCKNAIIIAALLHDVVEDTELNITQIQFLFGTEIANLVNKLTKLENTITRKIKLSEENNLHKLFATKDLAAFYIKLADRLHNMRTLHHIKSIEKQQRIALATLKIFVPLAKQVELPWIAEELQTLASAVITFPQFLDD